MFRNLLQIFEAIKNVVFLTMTEIACDQNADITLKQFYNDSNEHYCKRVIGNAKLLVYDAKHLIIPKVI